MQAFAEEVRRRFKLARPPLGRTPDLRPSQPPAAGDRYVDQTPRRRGRPDGGSADIAELDGCEGRSLVVGRWPKKSAMDFTDFYRSKFHSCLIRVNLRKSVASKALDNPQRPTTKDQRPTSSLHLNYCQLAHVSDTLAACRPRHSAAGWRGRCGCPSRRKGRNS